VEQGASISEEDRAYGAKQHTQLLSEFGGAYAGKQSFYLQAVGQRIAGGAGLAGQCHFTLVNSDVVNAFAVPGCIFTSREPCWL
jgi:predicted Zn-dependent protease